MKKRQILAATAVAFGCLVAVGVSQDLKAADWASWVQALGSIGAILAGFAYIDRQQVYAAREAKEAERLKTRGRLQVVLVLMGHAYGTAVLAKNQLKQDKPDWATVVGEAQRSADGLLGLPLLDLGSPGIVHQVESARSHMLGVEARCKGLPRGPLEAKTHDYLEGFFEDGADLTFNAFSWLEEEIKACSTPEENRKDEQMKKDAMRGKAFDYANSQTKDDATTRKPKGRAGL